jgi:PAS domain S-box-containing protein
MAIVGEFADHRFIGLLEAVPDAMVCVDADGRIAVVNAQAERLFGYARDELIGQPIEILVPDQARKVHQLHRAGYVGDPQPRPMGTGMELAARRRDGSTFPAEISLSAVEAGDGIVVAAAVRDVTERRLAAATASRRAEALPHQMPASARQEVIRLRALNLNDIVASVELLLRRTLGEHVELIIDLASDLPLVLADPGRIEQVLANLAVNARDAMPDGGRVIISGRREAVGAGDPTLGPGEYVVLSVRDEGHGMDEGILARAVDPFFTTKDVGKGTGLGLSMVHGLAAQSGGRLTIEIAPGKGTTVELWLVATKAAPPATEAVEEDQQVTLVVDDDPLVLTNTAALLEDLGYHVVCATSGAEALEAIGHHADLGLLITDFAMPGMTGVQLREAALRLRPGLPMLLLTGFEGVPSEADWPAERLKKPFAQKDLAEAVTRALAEGVA